MSQYAVRSARPAPELIPREKVGDVLRRRIHPAPDHLVREYIGTEPHRVQYYLERQDDYALVSLYPPTEARNIDARCRRFGQAFPGLFNVDGIPRSHDVRLSSGFQQGFIGAIQTRSLVGSLIMGADKFRTVIVANCFLRLEPDTSVALTRVRIKSPTRTPGFRYNIYFAFAVGFGHVAKPHDFVDRFEDTIVRYFERDHAEGITEVAEGACP